MATRKPAPKVKKVAPKKAAPRKKTAVAKTAPVAPPTPVLTIQRPVREMIKYIMLTSNCEMVGEVMHMDGSTFILRNTCLILRQNVEISEDAVRQQIFMVPAFDMAKSGLVQIARVNVACELNPDEEFVKYYKECVDDFFAEQNLEEKEERIESELEKAESGSKLY